MEKSSTDADFLSSWIETYVPLPSCLIFSLGDHSVWIEDLRSVGGT